jgi:NADPH2:quinone reductase
MRALVCHAWGAVEDLVVGELPAPEPAAEQVLIKVAATAVNFADTIMVGGTYQTKPPLPFAPGLETAGTVLAVGDKVTRFKVGDRVMALLAYGGLAEQALAAESDTFAIPAGMSFDDAAAFPVAYLSSDVALRWMGRLAAGETLLVLGAAGGVGLTAVEIGKAMGARVIAAASTPEKLAAAKSRGADELINYSEQDLTEAVMALTDNRGADVCFDPVGGALFDKALSSLGWGGRIVLVGFVGGIPKIAANRLLVKNRSALGSSLRHFRWNAYDKLTTSVETLFEWYSQGKLKPMITREFKLDDGVDALKMLTGRQAMGRILVRP